jgi:hypothetical protein
MFNSFIAFATSPLAKVLEGYVTLRRHASRGRALQSKDSLPELALRSSLPDGVVRIDELERTKR